MTSAALTSTPFGQSRSIVAINRLGAGSAYQTLESRRDLAAAESTLLAARTAYEKARIELDRSVGRTLDTNSISIESARTGVQSAALHTP